MNRKERRLFAKSHTVREWMLEMAMQDMAHEHMGIIGELLDEKQELRDAAEFEAKVAELVSDWAADSFFSDCESCPHCDECLKDSKKYCHWRILKDARLSVEEEMNHAD